MQLLFRGPLEYNSRLLGKLCKEIQIQIELQASQSYIVRDLIDEQYYGLWDAKTHYNIVCAKVSEHTSH